MRAHVNDWLWVAALGCLLFWPPASIAEEPISDEEDCAGAATVFAAGAHYRRAGHARAMKHFEMTPAQTAELEHRRRLDLPKDGMYVNGWDSMGAELQGLYEQLAFAGWDSANGAIADTGILTDRTISVMAGVFEAMCLEGRKAAAPPPEAAPEGEADESELMFPEGVFKQMKGQKFYCENTLPMARHINRDLDNGIRIEQLNFASEHDARTAKDVDWCRKAGEALEACVMRRCMGQET